MKWRVLIETSWFFRENAKKVQEALGQKPDLSQADKAVDEISSSEGKAAQAINDVDALFEDEEQKRKVQVELAEGQA